MKKFFTLLFALSSLCFLYFLYRWVFVEGGNEPIVTIFSGVLSPSFWFLRDYFSKKDANSKQVIINYTEASEPINRFDVTINKALIIADSEHHDYRFQIEVSMNAIGRSVYIRDINLECSHFIWAKPVIKLVSYFKTTGTDYLRMSFDEYREKVKTLEKNSTDNVIIRDDEWFYFLFTDITRSERAPDSYEDFELDGWNMIITYNDGQVKTIPFSFSVHEDSYQVPSAYRYAGFSGLKS